MDVKTQNKCTSREFFGKINCMNWQSFISLVQEKSDHVFFISSAKATDAIGETMSALLNSLGGTVVIGYDRINVHLTGYNQTDQWIDQFIDSHFKNSDISSTFLFRSNKKILLLDVKKSHHHYPYNGSFYTIQDSKITAFTPTITMSEPIIVTTDYPMKSTNAKPTDKAIASVAQQLSSINSLHKESPPVTTNNGFNLRQKKAIEFIETQGSIKNKQYRKLFNVSHKTAHLELAELVKQNKAKIVGSGRSTCYRLPTDASASVETSAPPTVHRSQISAYLDTHSQLTESTYADEFNMDLAQAINELDSFCDQGFLEKTIIDNEVCYVKSRQLAFM